MQGVFQHVVGVSNAVSGYAGGEKATARYQMVGSGATGHAEFGAGDLRSAKSQLRPVVADLFLGRSRSDPIEPAGTGCRHAISIGHFSDQRRASQGGARLYRSTRQCACIRRSDRDQHRAGPGFLSGRGLSSGFSGAKSDLSLYRRQRSAEDRGLEASLPGILSRDAGPGVEGGVSPIDPARVVTARFENTSRRQAREARPPVAAAD